MNNDVLINKFVEYLKRKKRSRSTLIAYEADIGQLAHMSKTLLIDLSGEDIKLFLKRLREIDDLTPKTVSRKLNSIKTFYKFLFERKFIATNPSLELHHPKFINAKPKYLTRDQYQKLRESCKANMKNFMMMELMLQTGLKISEVSDLKTKDIDISINSPKIIIRNGNEVARLVPLNDKIYFELKDYLSNSNKTEYLFTTKNKKPIEVRNIRAALDRVFSKVKLQQFCVNDLRNTFIVNQLINGMSLKTLGQIVGHKTISATERYIDILPKKYKDKSIEEVIEL